MQQRHLLPNEFDLLLDGEVGFGVAPLEAHVAGCPACSAQLADARIVVDALERLPRFAPSPRFANAVMANVQVVEPWHVALVEAAGRLVPRSTPLRVVMAATACVFASAISGGAIWLVFRADAAVYAFNLVASRARGVLVEGVAAVIGTVFGQAGIDAIRSGGFGGLALGATVALVAVGGASFGFRALATASRRVRE